MPRRPVGMKVASAGGALATIAVFVASLVCGLVAHLNLAPARRTVVARVNAVLAPIFTGRIIIERVGGVGLAHVDLADARVEDPDGRVVIDATGVSAHVATAALLRSLFGGDVVIDIPYVSVESARVVVDADEASIPRIANAFVPRSSSMPKASGSNRGVRLLMPDVRVRHALVQGRPAQALPAIDANVDGAQASLFFQDEKFSLDVHGARWAGHGVPGFTDQPAQGEAEVRLAVPSPSGRAVGLHVLSRGAVGAVALGAEVTYDSGDFDASIDVPGASPSDVKTLLPAWPLRLPVLLHAELHGTLAPPNAHLAARVHAAFGTANVDVEGPVTLAPSIGAKLHIVARRIDASAFAAGPPTSDLSARGDATLAASGNGAFAAHATVDVDAGRIATLSTPSMALTLDVAREPSPHADIEATARGLVYEAGAPTRVSARWLPETRGLTVSFVADSNASDLEQVVRLRLPGRVLHGRARAHAVGAVNLATGRLDGRIAASAETLDTPWARAHTATATAHVVGALSDPSFDVHVTGDGVEIGRLSCSSIDAAAQVKFSSGVSFENVLVGLRSSDREAHAAAKLIRVDGPRFRIDEAVVEGFGAPIESSVRYSPGELYVRARAGALELGPLARFTRVPIVKSGHLSFDIEADVRDKSADGRMTLDAKGVAVGALTDVGAQVHLTLHDRQAAGSIRANFADIGSLDVRSTSVKVGEAGILSASAWRQAFGAVDLAAHVSLAKLAAALPRGISPFTTVAGVLDVRLRMARDAIDDLTPDVGGSASTTGLVLAQGSGPAAWRLDGVDPTVDVTVDGDNGATAIAVTLRDRIGPIVAVMATSTAVPYHSLFFDADPGGALRRMVFGAHVDVPGRRLESLPPALGVNNLRGLFSASVDWHGSLLTPSVRAAATLLRTPGDPTASSLPLDLAGSAFYDGLHASASVRGSNRQRLVVDAAANIDARAADVLAAVGSAGTIPWTGSARLKVDELPLGSLPWLSDRRVRGKASGLITVDGLHDDARASAKITFDGLTVGDVACRSASIDAHVDGQAIDASARIDQADAQSGYGELQAHAGTHWGRALIPTLDASQAGEFTLAAKQFRAALLYPFVSGVLDNMDGRIDAAARVVVDAGGEAHPQGTIKLTDGLFEIWLLGGEFSNVSAQVTMTPDGVITLQQGVAHGITGKVEFAATARLNGFGFGGARATVEVPNSQPMPVVFDGVQIGTMNGHFDLGAELSPSHDALDVTLGVPRLHMALAPSGTRDIQGLGDLENVATGVQRSELGFVEVPLETTFETPGGAPRRPIKIAITLGSDVGVSRAPELDVGIQGMPVVTIANDVEVTGQIRITRGTIDVNGKPFQIVSGLVTFLGDDPSNPQVVLTAEWTAQDQTRVYADFSGPLKTGTVTLRSDPALPGGENDIRALLLFGTTESSTSVNQQTAPAAGAAGGVATQPINRFLSGFNRTLGGLGLEGGLSTKIDTSQANPRPEVELQIARDISLQVAWVLGLPAPGSNPDSYYVTLYWRFLRAWSLEATRGDLGTSILDLVWQHRY